MHHLSGRLTWTRLLQLVLIVGFLDNSYSPITLVRQDTVGLVSPEYDTAPILSKASVQNLIYVGIAKVRAMQPEEGWGYQVW